MAILQQLDNRQINEVLAAAVAKTVPLTLTRRQGEGWCSLHSRLLATQGEHLLVEMPTLLHGLSIEEITPAEKLGISFKLKHHKHLFTGTVVGVQRWALPGGEDIEALCICSPTKMQRLQRRAYQRVEVPAGRIVRAAFWLGGREAEPTGGNLERPVWSGRINNISAGGFQLITGIEAMDVIDAGDTMGVRVSFGTAEEAIFADAQLRHVEIAGEQVLLGFQFVGLGQTSEGRETLALISEKVAEMQRAPAYSDRAASRA
jgi:hypothetical protein